MSLIVKDFVMGALSSLGNIVEAWVEVDARIGSIISTSEEPEVRRAKTSLN